MSAPVLEARGLTRRFGALAAVDGVSLALWPGEIHALIGPNGAGKSTLIKLLTGELAADAGTMAFEGAAVDGLDAAGRARLGLARSFQVSQVVAGFSALENVVLCVIGARGEGFGLWRRATRDAALVAPARAHLARVGLAGRADMAAGALSHGERRRLEMAMALAMRPRAFLLDEPMAGMGADGARDLTALLSDLRVAAPILLVEHDMDAVFALADRVSVLVYGRIIATGTVEEIRANAEVRAAYLGEEEP